VLGFISVTSWRRRTVRSDRSKKSDDSNISFMLPAQEPDISAPPAQQGVAPNSDPLGPSSRRSFLAWFLGMMCLLRRGLSGWVSLLFS
jgi:hypothetical protein